jgi:PTS system nitrogen regulatory IIA component
MQLSVREVARLMRVPERTVQRWVRQEQLPAHHVGGQLRFNRVELLEWATAHKLPAPAELLGEPEISEEAGLLIAALHAGGVLYDLPGDDRRSALAAVVERMPLPERFDRGKLLELFLSRESLGSTGVGDGIAIPHPRYPVVLPVRAATATLCFLRRPIDFQAPDSRPVDTLFVLVSPTVRSHLKLLSQLAAALRDEGFRAAVRRRAAPDVLLNELRRVQSSGGSLLHDSASKDRQVN